MTAMPECTLRKVSDMDNNITDKTVNDSFDDYVFSEADDEYTPETETLEEYRERFECEKNAIKNPVKRFLFGKKYLGFCFLVPFALMALIYVALGVWPVGEHSALVLDLNAQYVYYIEKFRSIFTDGGSFLYSFERAVGGEFMGIFAYYIASPLNFLTLLFPKTAMTETVLFILLLKCGLCGFTSGIYFHNRFKEKRPIPTLIFSSMYALCSFAVVMQSNLMWTDNIILFTIILLGMDRLIKYGKFKTYTLALAVAVFSNFYIGYMTCLFVAIYFFVRFFSMSKEERNPRGVKLHFLKALGKVVFFSLIAVMIAAVVILCAYYSLTFGKLEFSEPNSEVTQMFDFANLFSKFYFGSYDTVRPEGMPFFYAGMLMTILAPLYFITPGIPARRKVGAGVLMAVMFAGVNLSTADLIWHGFQRPNWLNSRFIYMFVFIMLIMSYEVFVRIRELGFRKVVTTGGAAAVLLIFLQTLELENVRDFRTVWPSLLIIGIYLIALRFTYEKACRPTVCVASILLAAVVSIELFASGVVDVYAFDEDVVYSKRKSYRDFLDKYYSATEYVDAYDDGFYREEKLEHRKTNDNFALGIRGLSNSTSTLNSDIITLLRTFGYTSKSHWSKYVGGNLLSDSFFGIKYLYIDPAVNSVPDYVEKYYTLLTETNEGILVYENPYALSVAFEVSDEMKEYITESETPSKNLIDSLKDVFKPVPDENEETTERETLSQAELMALDGPFEFMNDIFAMTSGDPTLEIWKEQPIINMSNSGNRKFGVQDDHTGYEKNTEGVNATVTYTFEATDSNPVYMYVPTMWPREATYTVVGETPEITLDNGAVRPSQTKRYCTGLTYFTNDTHAIVEIGTFEPGETVKVTFTQAVEKFYVYDKNSFFYSYDSELVETIADKLTTGQMQVMSFEEDRITGFADVKHDSTNMLTTIPYDEGWHIIVDGEEIEYTKALGSLIMFELDSGKHSIEMYYMSDSFYVGNLISMSGVIIFALCCALEVLVPYLKKRRLAALEKGDTVYLPIGDGDTEGGEAEPSDSSETHEESCDTSEEKQE